MSGNIRIKCEDGDTSKAQITVGSETVDWVQSMDIKLRPNSFIEADTILCGLSIEASLEIRNCEISNLELTNEKLAAFGYRIIPIEVK